MAGMTDREQSMLRKVTAAYDAAKKFKEPFNEKAHRYYKLYRSWRENRHEDGYYDLYTGRSNLFIPYTFSLIETVNSRIILSLFAHSPYIGVIPEDAESVENAKNMEELINYQLEERLNIVLQFTDFVKECLFYGTAIGKIGWDYQERAVKRRVPRKMMGMIPAGWETKDVPEVVADDPSFVGLDWFNVFWDPIATNIEDARYMIYEYRVPLFVLKRLAQQGVLKNVDKIAESGAGRDEHRERRQDVANTLSYTNEDIFDGIDADKKMVKVWEYWEDEHVVMVANSDVVIRDEETPFWVQQKPFLRMIDTSVPHEFAGIGEIEVIEGLQNELNSTRNQRMDNVNLIIDRMFKVRRDAYVDHDELITRPGGIIHLDDLDDIAVMEWPDITASAYNEEEITKNDIQFALGIFDYAMGATPKRRETATTVVSLQQAANMRFKMKLMMAENMGLRKLAYWMGALNYQYINKPRTIRKIDRDGNVQHILLKPQDIWGRFGYRPRGSAVEPLANSQVRTEMLIQLFGLIANRPEIDTVQFTKLIVEEMGLREVERLFTGLKGQELEVLKAAFDTLQKNNQRADEIVQKGGNPGGVPPEMMREIMGGTAGKPKGVVG